MKLVPVGEKIIVKRVDADAVSPGGIILPDAAREKSHTGRVLSVGDGRLLPDGTRGPQEVSEGDRVLFSQWAGAEVSVDGETFLILDESEILAILR